MLVLIFAFCNVLSVFAQISPSEARDHVGQKETVCGAVGSTRYAFMRKGSPTLIHLGAVDDDLAIVIWGKHRKNFHYPDFQYADTHLCVTGKIVDDHGSRRIVAKTPAQIVVQPRPYVLDPRGQQ